MLALMISEGNSLILVTNMKLITVATIKVAAVFVVINLFSCGRTLIERTHSGEAQGTTYQIKYHGSDGVTQLQVDSVIESMDVEMNTWRSDARISKINNFNREDTVFAFYDVLGHCYRFCIFYHYFLTCSSVCMTNFKKGKL